MFLLSLICAGASLRASAEGDPAGPAAIGPPGRIVRALVLERGGFRLGESAPASAIYAGTDEGIFRSESGDGDWTRADAGIERSAITALAIFQREHPVEEPIVEHKTWIEYETTLYAGTRAGIFRSTDLGARWRSAEGDVEGIAVRSLLIGRDGAAYAIAEDGAIFRSANRGERWTRIGTGLRRPIDALAADPTRAGILYAATGSGLFRSEDGGRSWSPRPVGAGTDFIATSIAIDPESPSRILAAGSASPADKPGSSEPAAFASADGGASWIRLERTVRGPLLFDRGSPPVLYASAAGGALLTRDHGSTWSPVGDSKRPPAEVLAVDADWPGRIYGRAASGGVVRIQARCGAEPGTLCLLDGRFRVRVEWDGGGPGTGGGPAGVTATSDAAGSIWVSRPSNVILTVEIRDRRSANRHFWIDIDTRTARAFGVVVTDMATSTSVRYSHPEGQRTKFTDHEAF